MKRLFGVAGNPPNFWESKHSKDRAYATDWLNEIGLDAIELQYTRGQKISPERADLIRERAELNGIDLSIHASYFIQLASDDADLVSKSIERIITAIKTANMLNAKSIVFHPGAHNGDRHESIRRIISNLGKVQKLVDTDGITLMPEISGKRAQLGTLEEVIQISKGIDFVEPCIDFAHLHAQEGGSMRTKDDFIRVFSKLRESLSNKPLKKIHCHFYPIDYNHNGEVRHKAFQDKVPDIQQEFLFDERGDDKYYPRFEPFIDALLETNFDATVICEAKDSQDIGSLLMKSYYKKKSSLSKVQ